MVQALILDSYFNKFQFKCIYMYIHTSNVFYFENFWFEVSNLSI